MKTKTMTIYQKEYSSPIAYGYKDEHTIKSYVEIQLHFDFKDWLRFSVTVPNASFCYKNPLKAMLRALEHESIGMGKYNKLKEDTRSCGLWTKLDYK